jgi:REP element-mobilizing transposase RayT
MEAAPPSYPALEFLNEFATIQQLRNHLPHWRQDRVSCFLTFRLGDSIPAALLAKWREDRDRWRLANPNPWSAETEAEYHKRFSAAIDRYLDEGYGSCLLREPANAQIVATAFEHFDHSRYLLHAWVIMPNHVHMLLSPCVEFQLSRVVAGWKRFTATKIHAGNGGSGSLWQKDYFDRFIRDWDHFINVARYIRRNPSKGQLPDGAFLLFESPWVQRLLS